MRKLISIAIALSGLAVVASAQMPPSDNTARQTADRPVSYEAKYEGGIYGSTGRQNGTLTIDDVNQRLTFYRKGDRREMFSISYDSLASIYPDSKVGASRTGNVVSRMPLPGAGLAGLVSKRTQYLVINFDDSEIDVRGNASFKFENKKKLLSFINTLGNKAKMKQRGDAFYR